MTIPPAVRKLSLLILAVVLCGPAVAAPPQSEVPPPTAEMQALMEQALQRSGLKYRKVQDRYWFATCDSKLVATCQILMTATPEILVMGVVIKKKDALNPTPEMLAGLLHLNHNLERVKVGIDDDGDLFERVEVSVKGLDADEILADLKLVQEAIEPTAQAAQ
ncbi:MAG TPA: hypothetical protein VE825_14485 [Terriglobales bacterium]|jgi:hypothetical protein|nr:hypothetical protein [Terriglobales bacterium]